jgi:hypothetical protein
LETLIAMRSPGRPEKRSTSPISGTTIPASALSFVPKGSGRRTVLKHCTAQAT